MENQTVLIVDDDPSVRILLRNVLEGDGFSVLEANNAANTLEALDKKDISLITLDINLGRDNGVALAREIRQTSQVPIIMVTGKDDMIDRVVGLEVGADDYITKPFHVREVTARIRSVLRRTENSGLMGPKDPDRVVAPDIEKRPLFSFNGMTAVPDKLELLDRDNVEVGVTSGDFKLLMAFLERPKRVLSRDQLMDLTGGNEWNVLDRTIDNQVARLRKKIEHDPASPKLIKTVRGVGYTLTCDVQKIHATD